MAGIVERVKLAMGLAQKTAQQRYLGLLAEGNDADEAELLEVAQQLGKTPEALEADAAVIQQAVDLRTRANGLAAAQKALDAASLAGFAHDDEHKRRVQALQAWYEGEAVKLRAKSETARVARDDADAAGRQLQQLRRQHPDLLGQ